MKIRNNELSHVAKLVSQDFPDMLSAEQAYQLSDLAAEVIQFEKKIANTQKMFLKEFTLPDGNIDVIKFNNKLEPVMEMEIEFKTVVTPISFEVARKLKLNPVNIAELRGMGLIESKKETKT